MDGTVDPFLPDSVFTDSFLILKIDGRTVIDSRRHDLSKYYVPPTLFDSGVYYDEPTGYGSVGTLGFQSIGIFHGPLSVGKHKMELISSVIAVVPDANHPVNIGAIYHNTWNITVKR